MAVIKTKEKTLHKNRNRHYVSAIFGIAAMAVGYGVLSNLKINHAYYLILLTFFLFTTYHLNRATIISYGIKGEKKVLKKLKILPDNYMIYNDITIKCQGRSAQIDHLVISPKGIFCIETKNMKGKITGYEEDQQWIQRKIGRKGGVYYKNFRSPVKQCSGHVYVLKNYLKQYDAGDVWIQPVVVFARNWTSRLKVSTDTPVMKVNKLLKYIDDDQGSYSNISMTKIRRLEAVLDSIEELRN